MRVKVTVVDYGVGNLLSVCRAVEHCGADVALAESAAQILAAERLILPGVGAFADAMKALDQRDMVGAIQSYAQTGRLFLGICLGMQMMLSESDEFGKYAGLNLIPGKVVRISSTDVNGHQHKVPHIGWNQLVYPAKKDGTHWLGSILDGLSAGASAYFVHSFTALPDNPEARLADAVYGGSLLSAVIRMNNLYGCQFHPEKSGPIGLKIIENFIHRCICF